MIRPIFEEEEFLNVDFTIEHPEQGEYDNCEFKGCRFSDLDLSSFTFVDCLFKDCDLSTSKLTNTAFSNVRFQNCKLLGLQFDQCHDYMLSPQFENCQLNFSSFYQRKIKNTFFKDCQMEEVDFSETDLSNSTFDNCNLLNAVFDHTNLDKADLTTSYAFIIDPDKNRLKKTKFSVRGLPGLLSKYDLKIEL
nr:pentapeptide repeat-containing protein [uncultured Carboxylicivirga sp.]